MKILGADIGGTSIKLCVSNEKGEFEIFEEVPSNTELGGAFIMDVLLEFIDRHHNIEAIGISTAGQVDSVNGSIIYANENIPNYTGVSIKEIIQNRINVPVFVENDVNCAALGEMYFGAGKNVDDFLCLTYGTGIGGAIVHKREVFKGLDGIAGEFGHIITHANGRSCNCGGLGCYERYASTTSLIKQAQILDPTIQNGRELFMKIEEGDIKFEGVINEWINEVVYGLVTLTHIFNPPLIVVGGGIMERESLVIQIEEKFREKIMNSFGNVRLTKAMLGNKAGILGAISLVNQVK